MKTLLLTGATDGIGLETTKALIQKGHRVLAHGRDPSKLKSLADRLATDRLETFCADLADLQSVTTLAEQLRAQHSSIDVLINNAGVLKASNTRAPNGMDIRFVVNTLAPALLTHLLLPIIRPDGRVLNLSSAAQAPVDLESLTGAAIMDDMAAYAQSKLALAQWSAHLAGNVSQTVVAINPGSLLATKMVREGFGIAGNDINQGVDILLNASLGDEFAGRTGAYFDGDSHRFANPHPNALDSELNAQMSAQLHRLLGLPADL